MTHDEPGGLAVPDSAVPLLKTATVDLASGEKADIEFTPEQSGTTFYVPVVAVSKEPESSYTVNYDGGEAEYGPAALPPTDVDDLSTCWIPPREFDTALTVRIKNLSSNSRTYHTQVLGWED